MSEGLNGLISLKWALTEKFGSYFLVAQREVYTDSTNLAMWKKTKLGAIEQRWVAQISVFNYEIKHKPGRADGNADQGTQWKVQEHQIRKET